MAHVQAVLAHARARVSVACDLDDARLDEIRAIDPSIRTTADERDVLDDPTVDLVIIASYDDAHARQVLGAIERGRHVFVEKPLCRTVDELRAIAAALAGRPDVRLSSNLILRRSAAFRRMREVVRSGEIGEIYHVEGDYLYGRLHKLTEGWRGRIEGYSVVLGGAIHLVDLLLWITGDRAVRAMATGSRLSSRDSGFDGFDHVVGVLSMASGATAKVSANFGCVRPHGHALVLYGTRGTLTYDEGRVLLRRSRDAGSEPEVVAPAAAKPAKGEIVADFIDAILYGRAGEVSINEILDSMSVCLALDRAATSGEPVRVEEVR